MWSRLRSEQQSANLKLWWVHTHDALVAIDVAFVLHLREVLLPVLVDFKSIGVVGDVRAYAEPLRRLNAMATSLVDEGSGVSRLVHTLNNFRGRRRR